MEFTAAEEKHYKDISRLATSPEELFSFCATGSYPWDEKQIQEIAKVRKELTICTDSEKVIAFSNLYDVIPGKSAFIGNVIVSNSYQGKGIGKKLIQHMIDICHRDYDAIPHLSVFNFNAKALLIYTKIGFKPYGVKQQTSPNGETVALSI